jgi:hypothetical protein
VSGVIYLSARGEAATAELLDHPRTRLIGAALRWKRYRRWTSGWLLGQCELCGAAFTEGGTPGLNSGYSVAGGGPARQDDYVWICAICYETHRDHYCWTVLDTRGAANEPPGILDTVFSLIAWPVEVTADGGDGSR